MPRILYLFFLTLFFGCTDKTTSSLDVKTKTDIVPIPKSITLEETSLVFSERSMLYTDEPNLLPLMFHLETQMNDLFKTNFSRVVKKSSQADIQLELDASMEKDAYTINITDQVVLKAGSYQGMSMAQTTLLQMLIKEDGVLRMAKGRISDQPDTKYRGLMIDLARGWHEMGTLKQIIDMAAFYKVNYLHLHFTDYQSYTLPSKAFPKLSTAGKAYSYEELKVLENYSQLRGVTIVPEIDIPGHSSPFIEKYPDLFAIDDVDDNPYIINMGKEEVYDALEVIFEEVMEIFPSSPYIHIGGDEAIFHKVMEDADVQSYMQEKKLGDDVHELYRHFLVRMNDIIKSNGKQMCVWEGFRPEGRVEIPKDILVFEFETNRYLPQDLVRDGYQVVNTSWKPLYVVNQKKFQPSTIYDWNLWYWSNWYPKAPSFDPIQVEQSANVMGAEMCAWEQQGDVEIPSLRKRLPYFMERIWNTEKVATFDEAQKMVSSCDEKLTILINNSDQDDLLHGHDYVAEN